MSFNNNSSWYLWCSKCQSSPQIYSSVLRWYWQDNLQWNELAGSKRILKETAFPLCSATDNCWNRWTVSLCHLWWWSFACRSPLSAQPPDDARFLPFRWPPDKIHVWSSAVDACGFWRHSTVPYQCYYYYYYYYYHHHHHHHHRHRSTARY